MDLRQLRYFVKIAESGSFSRASETLHIAQPSLSQHIRNLEEELGVDLFSRHARGVTLNPRAKEFYEQACRILASVERARKTLQASETERHEKVTLGLSTVATRNLFLPLYRRLSEFEPNINLHLVEDNPGRLSSSLKAGQLDVALLYDGTANHHIAEIEILNEDLVLVLPSSDPDAHRKSINFRDLQEMPIVLPSRPHTIREIIDELAAESGVDLNIIDCDSFYATFQLISEAGHRTIMPMSALTANIAGKRPHTVPIVSPVPSWRMAVVVSEQTGKPRGSGVVARALAALISEQIASDCWPAPQV